MRLFLYRLMWYVLVRVHCKHKLKDMYTMVHFKRDAWVKILKHCESQKFPELHHRKFRKQAMYEIDKIDIFKAELDKVT